MQCTQKVFSSFCLLASTPATSHICDKEGKLTPHHIRFPSERRRLDLTQLKLEPKLELAGRRRRRRVAMIIGSSSRPWYAYCGPYKSSPKMTWVQEVGLQTSPSKMQETDSNPCMPQPKIHSTLTVIEYQSDEIKTWLTIKVAFASDRISKESSQYLQHVTTRGPLQLIRDKPCELLTVSTSIGDARISIDFPTWLRAWTSLGSSLY